MSKFHTNYKTGTTNLCRAEKGECPLVKELGPDMVGHSDSVAESRRMYEDFMEKNGKGDAARLSKKNADSASATPTASEQLEAQIKDIDNAIKAAEKKDKMFGATDEWFNMVQNRRKLMYRKLVEDKKAFDALSDAEKQAVLDAQAEAADRAAARSAEYKAKKDAENGPFNYHPTITEKNEQPVAQVMTSLTGLSFTELRTRVDAEMEKGLSRHDAYQKLWRELPIRTDKNIVSVDLETSAPMTAGKVDHGRYSSIIDFGAVVRHPDGTKETVQFMNGVPDDLMQTHGTGAEFIHHISPEMVAGKTPLVDDTARQKQIMEMFDGAVLLAHNASYETNNFKYSVPGFNKALLEGRIEVLDTMQVSRFFVPEAENNSNQAFVTATGGEYLDAHRSLPDATMSLEALERCKQG